jgi:transposase-like protein
MENTLSPLKNETSVQMKFRHQKYLDNLVESKHEEMKRKLLDLVDNIHKEE